MNFSQNSEIQEAELIIENEISVDQEALNEEQENAKETDITEITEDVVSTAKVVISYFKSPLLNLIYELIGRHVLLNRDLDQSILEYETNKYATALGKCKKTIPKLIFIVRQRREAAEANLKEWENAFFPDNDREATYEDITMSDDSSSHFNTIQTANKCIRLASAYL